MADTFGLLSLPASTTDDPVGDPALKKIGAFMQAVANAQLTAAWLTLRPRLQPQEQAVIKAVFTHDPDELCFNDKFLPALFIYRESGRPEQTAEDWFTDTTKVNALWVYPPEPAAKQRPRNPFVNAVAKALADALNEGRHPAWFDPGDTDPLAISVAASPNSFLLSKATQTSPVTYSGVGLDGLLGTSSLSPRLAFTVTTTAAAGSVYNTSAPIVVTYIDCLGRTATANIFLTLTSGGETVILLQDVKQLVSVVVPAQLAITGTLQFGNALRTGRGSQIWARAGLVMEAEMTDWKVGPVSVDVLDGEGRIAEKLTYPALHMTLELLEVRTTDLTNMARFTPAATGGGGVDLAVSKDPTSNGFVSSASLPDRGV